MKRNGPFMDFLRRHLFELVGAPFAIWLQFILAGRLKPYFDARWHRPLQYLAGLLALVLSIVFLISLPGISYRVPFSPAVEWFKAFGLGWALCTLGGWSIDLIYRSIRKVSRSAPFDPSRRNALLVGRAAAMSMPAAMIGYGTFIERHQFRLVEKKIQIPGLHKDLNGLRLVQLTDLHFGPFFGSRDLRYAIDMANSTKPHLALVTGDLITVHSDPLDECLDLLRGLRSDAGVLGCLGNHEIAARCQDYAEVQGAAAGIHFLRRKAANVRFGDAEINFGGVDYQAKNKPYLRRVAPMVRKDRLNILLSHNPDVFPVAAAQGWDLTVAGHTHGGQITVEILGVSANLARFYTPYVYGHYMKDGRQIYVSRGLGTVGLPSRLGAPPEVSLLTLCAT
jgi:predicted MPP superfamily phosphohydrolase